MEILWNSKVPQSCTEAQDMSTVCVWLIYNVDHLFFIIGFVPISIPVTFLTIVEVFFLVSCVDGVNTSLYILINDL